MCTRASKDWTKEPHSGGCFTALMPPGLATRSGDAIKESFGVIHWAGTETAARWTGYMEGALESGLRVAADVSVFF